MASDVAVFRHAVCLVDEQGRHLPRTTATESLACELLEEYGRARGGEPITHYRTAHDSLMQRKVRLLLLRVETWDYGRCTGYCMEFSGELHEPTTETRLKVSPAAGGVPLQDREEMYVVTAPQRSELGLE